MEALFLFYCFEIFSVGCGCGGDTSSFLVSPRVDSKDRRHLARTSPRPGFRSSLRESGKGV